MFTESLIKFVLKHYWGIIYNNLESFLKSSSIAVSLKIMIMISHFISPSYLHTIFYTKQQFR